MTAPERTPEDRACFLLSELFLDTDTRGSLDRLAQELRATGVPVAALDRLMVEDVARVCLTNLYSPAGEWEGFDTDWLLARIAKNRADPGVLAPVRRWMRRRALRRMVPEWSDLRARLRDAPT
ncbi:DUF7079 family protein [Jannaschia pohangensis]|uniref:DUF7079 domain-containing protein n=1 Tax=Jannaschia pohangensis TaxID=390807 RepID=A0A1I3S0P4_9RHOB|nr:hypothetical protein [Jannaschia pohangensis]SFJ52434.1 hypothetical protein SAMN04488095_2977 [Jannaschia pohangensis]